LEERIGWNWRRGWSGGVESWRRDGVKWSLRRFGVYHFFIPFGLKFCTQHLFNKFNFSDDSFFSELDNRTNLILLFFYLVGFRTRKIRQGKLYDILKSTQAIGACIKSRWTWKPSMCCSTVGPDSVGTRYLMAKFLGVEPYDWVKIHLHR
jgi:hypothetical protein